MDTEHSFPIYTLASIIGLPQRGGPVPAHRGHTVRLVRAALEAGASPAEILAMIPWGAHGSAFVTDRKDDWYRQVFYRKRRLVDCRDRVIVEIGYPERDAEEGDLDMNAGTSIFWPPPLRRLPRIAERRERRLARRAAVEAVEPQEREVLRQRLLLEDREALRQSSARRSADEKANAERVRLWWMRLGEADRRWANRSSILGEQIDFARNTWCYATHHDGWRFAPGQEGGRVSFAYEDLPDGTRVWHGAGRAIAEVEAQEAEHYAAEEANLRWESRAEACRVRGGGA